MFFPWKQFSQIHHRGCWFVFSSLAFGFVRFGSLFLHILQAFVCTNDVDAWRDWGFAATAATTTATSTRRMMVTWRWTPRILLVFARWTARACRWGCRYGGSLCDSGRWDQCGRYNRYRGWWRRWWIRWMRRIGFCRRRYQLCFNRFRLAARATPTGFLVIAEFRIGYLRRVALLMIQQCAFAAFDEPIFCT